MRPSYLYNRNPYTGKITVLYWDSPQVSKRSNTIMQNHSVTQVDIWEIAQSHIKPSIASYHLPNYWIV